MDFGLRKSGAGDAAAGSDLIKDTTTANFTKDVIEASKQALVLVDFWAAWCQPCKQLTPVLEKVVRSYNGKVRLVKLNVDEHPAIPGQLRIQSLPTVYAFRDGRPIDGFMGGLPESQVKQFIDRQMSEEGEADLAAALNAAEKALESGDLQSAAEVYATVLQEDRQNVQAIAGLAKCYLKSGDIARAEQTIALAPPDKRENAAVTGVVAAIELAKRAGAASGSTVELELKVANEPKNQQARLDLAMALAAKGEKSGALDHLLELFRQDRRWNDEAARKQLLQLFEAWGPKDPATIDGRRRLSSLLFS